jgi:hypothetical protein
MSEHVEKVIWRKNDHITKAILVAKCCQKVFMVKSEHDEKNNHDEK